MVSFNVIFWLWFVVGGFFYGGIIKFFIEGKDDGVVFIYFVCGVIMLVGIDFCLNSFSMVGKVIG